MRRIRKTLMSGFLKKVKKVQFLLSKA